MPLGRTLTPDEPPRRPLLHFLIAVVVLVLLAAGCATFGAALWVKHAMRASLPQLDGQIRLRGLSAPVTIRRDQHGVPHIEAANLDDLFMAQGYITAQDRLWEMDMARRMSAGDAAEILGSKLVEHDRVQRILGIRANAERLTASLSSWDRQYLEDYARGVNAYIADSDGHLPAEFRILHYQPKQWRPVDSMLVVMGMVQMLDQRWETKIEREQITAKLGPTLANTLYPTGSWRDHPPTQAIPDLTAPQQNMPDVPLDETQTKVEDLLHLRKLLDGGRSDCDECTPGSNEWVVSGAHTASGKPLLSNDMHLHHQIPNIWYESDLESGGFHVAGVTVPGIPYIIAGHNNHIAWGFTALYGDVQDLFVEQIKGPDSGQDEYKAADGWHAVEHSQETIHVRGGSDVTLDVRRTEHGPIVTPLIPGEKRTIALEWSAYDAHSTGIPLFALDGASNWDQFRDAMSHWWGPTQNVVYSDDQGHIGYQAIGNLPNRVFGLAPVPITDANHEWQGFVPFNQLPSTLDPVSGVIATANARITPDNDPVPLSGQWADPYRNERIWKWLAGKDKLTPADMLTLQTDVYSAVDQELAQRFAYAIDHANHPGLRLRQAADLLRSWDGVVGMDSPAASIVNAAKEAFWPMVLKPKLGDEWKLYHWAESGFAREQLITSPSPQWLPAGEPTWDDFLAHVVKQGMEDEHAPLNLKNWRYGPAHPVEVSHPLYDMLPWLKRWTGTGDQPQTGDTTTVKQSGHTFGPSQRFTMDWSNIDGSTENIVMGESGNPLSAYYRDQWPYWYSGKTFALPFTSQAVAAQTTHTLRLIP